MAEDPDELICNFDTGHSTMEVTTVLLFGWAIFCVLLVALGRYVNRRFLQPHAKVSEGVKPGEAAPPASQDTDSAKAADAQNAVPIVQPTVKVKAKTKEGKQKRKIVAGSVGVGELFSAPSVPATPPSPGATPLRDVTAPFATGPDRIAVNWVNDLLQWLYTDPTPTPYLQSTWIKTLNGIAEKQEAESGVQIRFQEVASNSELPNMTNVMADPGPTDNNINILTDIESTVLTLIVQVTRQTGDNYWSTEYSCNVNTLSGPLSVVCNTDSMTGTVHFDCRPKIELNLVTNPRCQMDDPVDELALQQVVSEIIANTLAQAAVEVDVNQFPRCPRFIRKQMFAERVIPVHYDSMIPVVSPTITSKFIQKRGKRLFVKVIKANNLGSDKGCVSPMCTVELDEPAQKHSTGVNEGVNPFWDEHFLLDLSNETGEILFEVWDKNPQQGKADRFLGLGIISVDDLLRNPSQRQIISLQSRPYEGDDVSGSLTVEFLCMEAVDVPKLEKERPPRPPPPSPTKVVDSSRVLSSNGATMTTTTTTIRQPFQGPPEIIVNGEDTVTSTALRELSRPHPPTTTERSTLIIHSVQRESALPTLKIEKTKNGIWHEVSRQPSDSSTVAPVEKPAPLASDETEFGRSRPKERKSFMSTLKKRLSFRGKRSRSVGQHESSSRDSSASRSTSVDRARSTPGSREDNASTRSSLSEMSGMSGSSVQTYVDEASMLIIEAVENGITKHYLIPSALASKGKWKKRGTKLHIFNDHTFVAKHLPSNIACQVCTKPFVRRIGKQGYECRDCQLKCHKPCHVRTDIHCPSSSVGSMELIRDWWVEMPLPHSVQKRLSLKNKIKRISHGLEPIPSNDTLPTNAEDAKKNNKGKASSANNFVQPTQNSHQH